MNEHKKEVALKVLKRMKTFDRYSIIAGGFPRDLFFNKEPRDIDIYIRAIEGFNTEDYRHFMLNLFPEGRAFVNTGSCNSITIPFIHNTLEFIVEDIIINVIAIKGIHPSNVTSTFDFDICKFILDSNGDIVAQFDISKLINSKISELSSNVSEEQYAYIFKNHLPKLKEKFPEFKFVL